jgi:hypothetical protein
MNRLTDYLDTAADAGNFVAPQNTIREWTANGDIPMQRKPANRSRLFKRRDLDAFLKIAAKLAKHGR